MTDLKLAQLANMESWQIIKKLLNQTAKRYYSWDSIQLEQAKGANDFKDLIIRKVEGAKDSLPTKTTAE